MGDLRERIRHDDSALQKLMEAIPGYPGYHDKEVRRTADKVLRDHLVGLLEETRSRLGRLQSEVAQAADLKAAGGLDRVARRMLRAQDRLQHASYGYAGFFDAVQIGPEKLDRLYDYDLALKDFLGKIDSATTAVIEATAEARPAAINALGDAIDELLRMLDARGEAAAALTP